MWNRGNTVRNVSSPVVPLSQAAHATALETKFMCVSMAPFEVPVVPPVYCKAAKSSRGLMSTLGGFGRYLVRRSCIEKMFGPYSTLWDGIFLVSVPSIASILGM